MKHFCVFLLLCTLFVGCTSIEDEFNALNDNSPITRAINPHRTNPYVLSLVQDIANQVYIEHGCDSITLTPTDYYVCFTPKDSIQMETLWDLNVTLFNHPLDQLLSDQEIEAFRATHSMTYFAMIPATMTLPDTCLLNYQILDEAYILYPSQSTTRSFNAPTLRFYDEIYQRTLEATGNHATRTEVSEWIPSAHITYAEDKPGWEKNEPMPGVRVSVQDFYRVETKKTNKNGDTGAFGIFSNPVRYQIDWSDEKWEMSYTVPQNEVTSEISSDNTDIFPITDGPADSTEPWFYCVPPALQPHDSKDLIFAAAHKALYAYYYGEYPELTELTRLNFDEAVHVRIMFWYAADAGGRYGDNLVLLWPVWSDGKYIYKHHVVEMTLHELGHGAEDMIHNSLDYGYLEMAPAEAWANFHTYLFMNQLYPGDPNEHLSWNDIPYNPFYRDSYIGPSLYKNQLTIAQIEETFRYINTWEEWKTAVKNSRLLPEQHVDLLFQYPNLFNTDIDSLICGPSIVNIHEPTRFHLPDLPRYQPEVLRVTDWTYMGTAGDISDITTKEAYFTFAEPGEKTIVANVRVADSVTMVLSKRITVPGDIIQTSAKVPYLPNTTYKLYYNLPDGCEAVSLVFNYLPGIVYIDMPIQHHPEEHAFSFQFSADFPIDYMAWLTYTDQDNRTKLARYLFSNLRTEVY